MRKTNWGPFHYAKPTGQRSVGIPAEYGTAFSDYTETTNVINYRNGCLLLFRIP